MNNWSLLRKQKSYAKRHIIAMNESSFIKFEALSLCLAKRLKAAAAM